jgi:Asp-tRNA(Asn)/Glu-tRNA(Gln) amidotransferase A subunit family amidase
VARGSNRFTIRSYRTVLLFTVPLRSVAAIAVLVPFLSVPAAVQSRSFDLLSAGVSDIQAAVAAGALTLDAYLSRRGSSSPVKSLAELVASGKFLTSLEPRLQQADALVYPFKSLGAPAVGEGDRGSRDNPLSAVTGLPAIVVPAGVTREGFPISLEMMGRPFSEPTLIRMAHAYEQATHKRVAPSTTPHLPGETFSY